MIGSYPKNHVNLPGFGFGSRLPTKPGKLFVLLSSTLAFIWLLSQTQYLSINIERNSLVRMPAVVNIPDETSALLGGNNSVSHVDGITERRDVNNADDTPIPKELPSLQLIVVLLAVWVRNKIPPMIC